MSFAFFGAVRGFDKTAVLAVYAWRLGSLLTADKLLLEVVTSKGHDCLEFVSVTSCVIGKEAEVRQELPRDTSDSRSMF